MTPAELKRRVEGAGHEPHFFDRGSMRCFGDTMRNYGVRDAGDCWELYRKRAVKHGLRNSAFFDKETLRRVFRD